MLCEVANMKELKVAVERVVRPIRASARRKDRMREELLAHLTGILEQELAQTKDRESVLAQALRRFGDCEELRRELQDSVPALERVLHAPIPFLPLEPPLRRYFAKREDESALHHAGRSIGFWALYIVACDALLIAISLFRSCPLPEIARSGRLILGFHGPFLFCGFFYLLLLHGFALAIRHRPLRLWQLLLAGTYCVLSAPLLFACVMMTHALVGNELDFSTPRLVLFLAIGVALMPFVSAFIGLALAAESRRWKEWESLVIKQ